MSFQMILGPMFAGKTAYLFSQMEQFKLRKQKCAIIRFAGDKREAGVDAQCSRAEDANIKVQLHNGINIAPVPVYCFNSLISQDAAQVFREYDAIGIDEMQLFGSLGKDDIGTVLTMIEMNVQYGKNIFGSAIDSDYRRKPIDFVSQLSCNADNYSKKLAICKSCGADAPYSARKREIPDAEFDNPTGSEEKYTALCRKCWIRNAKREWL